MKALTLLHPWPYAVVRLGKRIENRKWKTTPNQLAVGEVFAIHGGAAPKGRALRAAESDLCHLRARQLAPLDLPIGSAVLPGVVALAFYGGAVTSSRNVWFSGPYGWLLSDVFALPEPVPCPGKQGLWDLPASALDRVRALVPPALHDHYQLS
jgi:hypothetical protein